LYFIIIVPEKVRFTGTKIEIQGEGLDGIIRRLLIVMLRLQLLPTVSCHTIGWKGVTREDVTDEGVRKRAGSKTQRGSNKIQNG
jgi:hypothetical protein